MNGDWGNDCEYHRYVKIKYDKKKCQKRGKLKYKRDKISKWNATVNHKER